ncbi:MAG TPA: NAD(P)/FAD-dependent oxidoreductase [Deltaproteobacteria bacterium]|nr:NAD(P)/FAD-dependent oxidoreductase [Deltaproteobacteria bacterium]
MAGYDVVVIGAGNGGLTGAVTLAKAGRKVLLLERHNVPGGCATSFVRGRFEFEVALHQLSGMGSADNPGPLRVVLNDLGVMDKLDFVSMESLYRVYWPGKFDITLKAERQAIIQTLQERFPKEKDGITKFFDLLYGFSMQMIQGLFFRDPDISKEKYPLYFKYAFAPTQRVLDEFFEDPLLKAVLSIYWSYTGVPPRWMPFGDFAIMLFAYIEFKPYHLKGGSQALSNALLNEFLACGGEARFSCGAAQIGTSGGRVTSVTTEHGDTVETQYVLSNASVLETYLNLMDPGQVPPGALDSYRSSTIGPSAFTLYMGFDCEPGELGIDETTNFITTTDDMDKTFAQWKTMEQQGVGLLTCYDVSDPDFSPAGTCQAAFVNLQYADPWYLVPPGQYYDAKFRYAEGMLKTVENAFPGIRGHIEEIEAATPITHLRYLGHPGGAIYGFDQYTKDTAYFIQSTVPIEGLYFAGAWVGSGGFQPTLTSGRSSGRAILKSMAKR